MVRTGYDAVIAHRTPDLFAKTAEKKGKVTSVNSKGIVVTYEDGEIQGVELGRRFGNAAGLVIPHEIVTPLKEGDEFNQGDPLAYNSGFFEPDFFNPKQIVMKNSTNARVALLESMETFEDSCAISKRLSERLITNITKVKTIVVTFDQAISNLVAERQEVDADTILCIIEDAVSSSSKLFDEQSIQTLRAVGAQSPRAHVKGTVESIEVYYHGEKDEMTPSLRELAEQSDKAFKKRAKSANKPIYSGQVDGSMRIDNNPLLPNQMAVRIYITTPVSAGVGDKTVFANQMKSVIGQVIEGDMTSEDGQPIDAEFGVTSIFNRIVNNPFVIGTTNGLLKTLAKRMVEVYRAR